MDDLDALAQLVFFVLIILGWVIKAIVDAKQAKQRRSAPPPVEAPDEGEARDRVVRPRPHPPTRPAPSAPAPIREGLGQLNAHLTSYALDPTVAASTPRRLLGSSAAAIAHGARTRKARRTRILGQLTGGLAVAPGRHLTRAGILWSEILGPCRALRGPHRSPAATRRRTR